MKHSYLGLAALMLLLNGCTLLKLKQDLNMLEQQRTIGGTVVCDHPVTDSVVVVLWALDESGTSGYWLSRCGMEFSFMRDSGRYYLMAYADANEDGRYQETEYAGIFGNGKAIDLSADSTTDGLELRLLPPGQAKIPSHVKQTPREEVDAKFALRNSQLGELTTMDNPLFTDANGSLGLWTPVRFIEQFGIKVYFLEPYAPEKIPVLFIHGSSGHPGIWKPVVENLDPEKYQPWLAFYPSGMRLDTLGKGYAGFIDELRLKHGFGQIHVVGHSMGGLVARSMVQHYARLSNRARIPMFVTFATPWEGHSGARAGVRYAPDVVPCWYDMVPGSAFLRNLEEQPLPAETGHHLFFAYRGKATLAMKHVNNDGVVTLRSQLSSRIQAGATRVVGIDADHVEILSAPESLKTMDRLFD
ncbi:hypothetical protein PDESU_01423 [Pontiella desulfatans]|uniref:AB hydrolase-1 domain-containing protein n=1 Tax=Pontiella desulfatans TaxID=2750659 RepID=A0A6C2TZ60_PONDE|nr:alpha/beta hydrolase [Pontiella desulfatans]VGO12869.1 hypothetical protein PDESU_01423 [Pontiella desulfatans]